MSDRPTKVEVQAYKNTVEKFNFVLLNPEAQVVHDILITLCDAYLEQEEEIEAVGQTLNSAEMHIETQGKEIDRLKAEKSRFLLLLEDIHNNSSDVETLMGTPLDKLQQLEYAQCSLQDIHIRTAQWKMKASAEEHF